MKKLFLILPVLTGLFAVGAKAESILSLSQAWTKARQNSLLISVQSENLRLVELRSSLKRAWDDPMLEYSSGSKVTAQGDSRVSLWTLRQRIPSGSDRQIDRLSAEGDLRLEILKSAEIEKDQESKFVLNVYALKVWQEELQQSNERLQRIAGIRNFLQSTKAYTSSAELDRTLIELRFREIEDRKIKIETKIALLKSLLKDQGLEGTAIQTSWMTPELLGSIVKKNPEATAVAKQRAESLRVSQAQAEVSILRPQVDLFASRLQEFGGSEELSQSLGVGLTIPFFSYFSEKQKSLKANSRISQMQWEITQRQDANRWRDIQKLSEQVVHKMKIFNETNLKNLKNLTPTFTAALKKGQITISQFLDYEDRVYGQVESFYENQIQGVELAAAANLYFQSSLVETLKGSNE